MGGPLTLADIPVAKKPGEPGLRVDGDGRVWIPIGLNVFSKTKAGAYFMPQYMARHEWHLRNIAGGKPNKAQIQVRIAKCSRCHICIGRGYVQTELYVRPVIAGDIIKWKTVCGRCATTVYNLSFGFCLVADRDWSGPHSARIQRHWAKALTLKCADLEEQVIDRWNNAELMIVRKYRAKFGTLKGYPRQRFLSEFVMLLDPDVPPFTDYYDRIVSTTHHRGNITHAA